MFERFRAQQEQLSIERRDAANQTTQATVGSTVHPQTMAAEMQYHNDRADMLMRQQEIENELNNMIQEWRGYERNSDGDWVRNQNSVKSINERGISAIRKHLRPFINISMTQSKMDEEIIANTMCETADEIVHQCTMNREVWEVPDNMGAWAIRRDCINFMKPIVYRSLGGWNKETDATMVHRSEVHTEQKQEERKKFLGMF